MRKRILVVLVAVLSFLGLAVAPSASADHVVGVRVSNAYSGLCLTQYPNQYRVNNATVYMAPCDAYTNYQRWTQFTEPGYANYKRVYNWGTEGCLNADTARAYTNVPCYVGAQWNVIPSRGYSGAWVFQSAYNLNYCLGGGGGWPLAAYPCNHLYLNQNHYLH